MKNLVVAALVYKYLYVFVQDKEARFTGPPVVAKPNKALINLITKPFEYKLNAFVMRLVHFPSATYARSCIGGDRRKRQ